MLLYLLIFIFNIECTKRTRKVNSNSLNKMLKLQDEITKPIDISNFPLFDSDECDDLDEGNYKTINTDDTDILKNQTIEQEKFLLEHENLVNFQETTCSLSEKTTIDKEKDFSETNIFSIKKYQIYIDEIITKNKEENNIGIVGCNDQNKMNRDEEKLRNKDDQTLNNKADSTIQNKYVDVENKNQDKIKRNEFLLSKLKNKIQDKKSISQYKIFDYNSSLDLAGKLSYLESIREEYDDIKKYFKDLVNNITDEEKRGILEELQFYNQKMFLSSGKNTDSKKICIKFFFDYFKSSGMNFIEKLENRFFIRINYIYKFSTDIKSIFIDEVALNKRDFNDQYKFLDWYSNFIQSSDICDFFTKPEVTVPKANNQNFESRLEKLLNEFSDFRLNYLEKNQFYFQKNFCKYSIYVRNFFNHRDYNKASNKIKVWLCDLLNNETNSVLMLIFPELKIFINKVYILEYIAAGFKKIHYIFSFLIFKFILNIPFFKLEILSSKNEKDALITNSKHFNKFCLEIRCLMSYFLIYFIDNKRDFKLIIFRAFISFIRLQDPDFINFLIINEYSNLIEFTKIDELLKLNCNDYEKSWTYDDFTMIYLIKKIRIDAIDKKMLSIKYYKLDDLQRKTMLYNVFAEDNDDIQDFFSKNNDTIYKVTKIFKEWFKD